MSDKEKLLNEIHGLLQPYRKQAKEVNFNPNEKKRQDELKAEYMNGEVLEIIGHSYTIRIQIL